MYNANSLHRLVQPYIQSLVEDLECQSIKDIPTEKRLRLYAFVLDKMPDDLQVYDILCLDELIKSFLRGIYTSHEMPNEIIKRLEEHLDDQLNEWITEEYKAFKAPRSTTIEQMELRKERAGIIRDIKRGL